MATVLVTGGAGFIGSHTCVELLGHGHDDVVVDDHSPGSPAALDAVQAVAGRKLTAHRLDVR
ncbi:NAD-dependent epimerase/dehydratase family protein, partial [Pseudonocardia sp.]|uniref:NAD-dependent epimerase/dehydratase family protein n=1 Tax=Pseudonocardia sp. TaxID=60912 RepID=UPI003D0DD0AC